MNVFTRVFTGCCLAATCWGSSDPKPIDAVAQQVLRTIEHADEIPGFQAQEFQAIKPKLLDCWTALANDGYYEVTGPDGEARPIFVSLQGIIEHVLSSQLNKSVYNLQAIIHTPMPATPLCTNGEISPELMSKEAEHDPLRVFTVKTRSTIVRDFLHQGGKLTVAYPAEGMNKRTAEQQIIYSEVLQAYPREQLVDLRLNCQSMDRDMIGALYLFEDAQGNQKVFAISIPQVNDTQEMGTYGLWYGDVCIPQIAARKNRVETFIQANAPLPSRL